LVEEPACRREVELVAGSLLEDGDPQAGQAVATAGVHLGTGELDRLLDELSLLIGQVACLRVELVLEVCTPELALLLGGKGRALPSPACP
jgi:hypothetical protein